LRTFFAKQAAIVAKWLSQQEPIFLTSDGSPRVEAIPNFGLLAFNRRFNNDSKPFVFVYPILSSGLPKATKAVADVEFQLRETIVSKERKAAVVDHFNRTRVKSEGAFDGVPWGNYAHVDALGDRSELVARLENGELDDNTRNKLDLLWFEPEEKILSFPVPVLGSPVLTCYLAMKHAGNDFQLTEDIRKELDAKLRAPLSAFITTNIISSFFVLAKFVSLSGQPISDQVQQFLKIVAELLFAKTASIQGSKLFADEEPLSHFDDGAELTIRHKLARSGLECEWSATLPSYNETSGGNKSFDPKVASPDSLLKDTAIELLKDILTFMDEADVTKRRELQRSHQMLMKLQAPLDALSAAFNHVQAEAQEMQSILNDPEVALFATHKVLTELFIEGREIKLSDAIRLKMRHSKWIAGGEEARRAYAYSICRVFGCHNELAHCQNTDAVEATAQQLLDRIERDGVHSELLATLAELVLPDFVSSGERTSSLLRSSLALLPTEKTSDEGSIRKGKALDLWVKPVVFTPFKSFGASWPKVAFQLAFYGKRFKRALSEKPDYCETTQMWVVPSLDVYPAYTPFPQSAILDFIINFCTIRDPSRRGDYWPRLSFDTSANHVEVRLHYKGDRRQCKNNRPYWHKFGQEPETQLPQFLKHAIRYSGTLGNCGDFLNVFGSLIKKGLGLASSSPEIGEWILVSGTDPERQMLVLGRCAKPLDTNGEPSCDRYFEIYQVHENEASAEGKVVLRWADSLAASDVSIPPATGTTLVEIQIPIENAAVQQATERDGGQRGGTLVGQADVPRPSIPLYAVIDHDNTGYHAQLINAVNLVAGVVVFEGRAVAELDALFIHHPVPHTVGQPYLQARIAANRKGIVILLSSDVDELEKRRAAFDPEFQNMVVPLENTERLSLDTDAMKRILSKILEIQIG